MRLICIHLSTICKNTKSENKCTTSLWEIRHRVFLYYTIQFVENAHIRESISKIIGSVGLRRMWIPSKGNKRRIWSCFSGDENDLKFVNGHIKRI